jgi:hypothetical protein
VNKLDPHSETWRAVTDFIEERLDLHRRTLETIGLPEQETDATRGAIQELKEILELAVEREPVPDELLSRFRVFGLPKA